MIRPSSTSRRGITATLVLAALALGGVACSNGDAAAGGQPVETAVTVGAENIAVAQQTKIESGPAVSGSLTPKRAATVRAEVSGSIVSLTVDAGQRVAAGEQIGKIDDASIQDTYLSARSGVASAQNALDVATNEERRATAMLAAGAIAERELEQAKRMVIASQAQLADAQARVSFAQRQMDNTKLIAPFAGIISEKQASVGDIVQPGMSIVTVVDPSSMELEAAMPAEQLGDVRVGMRVSFTVSGYPGRPFVGSITRINPSVDPATRQVRLYAEIPNTGAQLVAGLFASGRVSAQSRTALTVPQSAVDVSGLSPIALRVRGGKVEKVDVQIGLRDPATERIEITGGLAAGDTVLTGTAMGLTPGSMVKIGAAIEKSGGDK
jgi:RND family efflux transporter MFP subunit